MNLCEDPGASANNPKYHTGKPCIERGCTNPAGTAWSPHWCQPCNAKRLMRVSEQLAALSRSEQTK
jgi:hypothetical protein